MTYLGNWMINSHQVETEQDLRSGGFARLFPCGIIWCRGFVEKDPDDGIYSQPGSSKILRLNIWRPTTTRLSGPNLLTVCRIETLVAKHGQQRYETDDA